MKTSIPVVLAVLLALPGLARAQKPISETNAVEESAKIEAIDHDNRLVTLRDKDGNEDTVYAGPEVKRFDELKVGDTVTFRFYESLVYQIRKAGETAKATGSGAPTIVRNQGTRPGGTAAQQHTVTVTVKAIDPKVPSVTVVSEDGHTTSHKVEDKKYIQGLSVGDKVEITYTEAVMISVK
jgi:hypothetical protein